MQQMHATLVPFTSCEANDIVAIAEKPTGGVATPADDLPWDVALSSGTPRGIECWESVVSQNEKMLKSKMDDEIKLAGLETLVPEELERHLILNSNRLRTFEDARREVLAWKGS